MEIGNCKRCGKRSCHLQLDLCPTCYNDAVRSDDPPPGAATPQQPRPDRGLVSGADYHDPVARLDALEGTIKTIVQQVADIIGGKTDKLGPNDDFKNLAERFGIHTE